MGRYAAIDREDDFEDDPEDPDRSDMDDESEDEDDGNIATDECPHCGAEVYEFAEKCPTCDRYLSKEDAPLRSGHPKWIVVTALILLVPMLYALLKWWF